MSSKPAQQSEEGLQSIDVAAYLSAHPDFFHQHQELLEALNVPHACGDAVSLVAKQIELLRDKNRKLQVKLSEILQNARDNDAVFRRIHELTLALLEATSVEDALASLRWILHEAFQADFVTLRVFDPQPATALSDLYTSLDRTELNAIRMILEAGVPVCGVPSADKIRCLFDSDGDEVLSYALIPLRHAGVKGFLAIGSRSAQRFQTTMGNFFLAQIGEIVAARLADLLRTVGRDHAG
jgi:uncharacterized protein YigA (DUF484 family)